jgi:CBS domain-containing protein
MSNLNQEGGDATDPWRAMTVGPDAEAQEQDSSFVGIFHLVNSLLPDEQIILSVPPYTHVRDALKLMQQYGFSQLPVMEGDLVLGAFSYRSFAKRVAELGRIDVDRLEVDDCIEDFEFVRVTDELERMFFHLDRDGAVLVGDPDRLLAVATSTDLIHYLYKLTHPFVLIQEIELVLRRLVTAAVSKEDVGKYIRRAVSSNYKDREDQIPAQLKELSCAELVQTVIHSANYTEVFSKLLGSNRDSTRGYLGRISGIRNDVFHFRRPITEDDVQILDNARTWLLRKARAIEAREGTKS